MTKMIELSASGAALLCEALALHSLAADIHNHPEMADKLRDTKLDTFKASHRGHGDLN